MHSGTFNKMILMVLLPLFNYRRWLSLTLTPPLEIAVSPILNTASPPPHPPPRLAPNNFFVLYPYASQSIAVRRHDVSCYHR
jgi:hypothetical protein